MAFGASRFNQATLYAFRYFLGYGFLIGILLFIVTVDIGNVPNGLNGAEMSQAVTSSTLHFSWDFGWIINGSYNFLQQLSVEAFGLSRVSLILPSLIFGSITIVLFTLTMRQWFRDSVAIVTTAIVATSVPFISMLRSGTPDIMVPFWTMLLLYGAVRLLIKRERAFGLKLLIVFASVGLLSTPYGIYPFLITFGSAIFHPHVRSRIRHIKPYRIAILIGIIIVGITPLVIHLVLKPSSLISITGIDLVRNFFEHPRQNIALLYHTYFNFQVSGFAGTAVVPMYNVATVALIVLGVLRSLQDRFTARSYVLLPWTALTILTAIIEPTLSVLTFVPASLLLAIGIDTLVIEWYRLFPRNPYARVAGLVPLVIEGNHSVTLVTSPNDIAFYNILKKEHSLLKVTTTAPTNITEPVFVIPTATTSFTVVPSRILTSQYKENSAILRIYRPQ